MRDNSVQTLSWRWQYAIPSGHPIGMVAWHNEWIRLGVPVYWWQTR